MLGNIRVMFLWIVNVPLDSQQISVRIFNKYRIIFLPERHQVQNFHRNPMKRNI